MVDISGIGQYFIIITFDGIYPIAPAASLFHD